MQPCLDLTRLRPLSCVRILGKKCKYFTFFCACHFRWCCQCDPVWEVSQANTWVHPDWAVWEWIKIVSILEAYHRTQYKIKHALLLLYNGNFSIPYPLVSITLKHKKNQKEMVVWGLSNCCLAEFSLQIESMNSLNHLGWEKQVVGFSWQCALEPHLSSWRKFLLFPMVSGCKWLFCRVRSIWDGREIASWHSSVLSSVPWAPVTCHVLSPGTGGSRVSKRDLNPPSQRTWSLLLCPARPSSRDLPNVFRSLGSFSALGSHLFGVWNVLFWFWVKPQEKGFYFWNAHFQLYIPLDGIRFSGIGVCTNGILSHVSSKRVVLREGGALVSQQSVVSHMQRALDV